MTAHPFLSSLAYRIAGTGLVILAGVLLYVAPVRAEKRVALVIGNSAYVSVPRLDNPRNDARLMADTLRSLGFTLVGGGPQLDLTEQAFRQVVQDFGKQLEGSDVGLFYYAGHGVQARGSNYLVPVDANPVREADVDFQMLDTNLVLLQMEGAGTKLNLVILDACRNNPLAGRSLRSVVSGLATMQTPEGTLISFATQPGNVAQDGSDGHSPYTKALAQSMRKPGLDVFRTFNDVGLAVASATGGAQKPWVSLSPISGDFYFAGPISVSANVTINQTLPPQGPATQADPCSAAEAHWKAADAFGTIEAYEDHLVRFANCAFAGFARGRIDELKSRLSAVSPSSVSDPSAQSGATDGAHESTSPGGASAPMNRIPLCDKPNSMGLARVVEIDTTGGPAFGTEHFKQHDFLREHEVVLTFDDGPWPENTPAVIKPMPA